MSRSSGYAFGLSLIFSVAGFLLPGRGIGIEWVPVVLIDFLMMFVLLLVGCATVPRLASRGSLLFWLVPFHVLLLWFVWTVAWAPIFIVLKAFAPAMSEYAAYGHRFEVMFALAALVVVLALPGVWWWRRVTGATARGVLLVVHLALAVFLALLSVALRPIYL